MIAFCTHCFDEIASKDHYCPYCGIGLGADSRIHDRPAVKMILERIAHTKGSCP
jgi:hypothetical protein